jgi:hypothetical protein
MTLIFSYLRKPLSASSETEITSNTEQPTSGSIVVSNAEDTLSVKPNSETKSVGDEDSIEEDLPSSQLQSTEAHSEDSYFPSELLDSLTGMGFSRPIAVLALTACGGDSEEALNYILANGSALEEIAARRAVLLRGSNVPDQPITTERKPVSDSAKIFHYDGECKRLLSFYAMPDTNSERLGCVYPGDDMTILEERVVDGHTWYKLSYCEFDDGNLQSTYGDELQDVLVWAPKCINGVEVVKAGSFLGETDCELDDPPGDTILIDKYYKVIVVDGTTVRAGLETSSNELLTIIMGDFVHACAETYNFDCTLRLKIDYPVHGWISKIFGLVERVEPDSAMLEQIHKAQIAHIPFISNQCQICAKEKLLNLEDSMETLSSSDAFNKEDRFFGHMQGEAFKPYRKSSIKQASPSRPSKLQAFKSSLEKSVPSPNIAVDRYKLCITPMLRLYCRKLLILLAMRTYNSVKFDHVCSITIILKEYLSPSDTSSIARELIDVGEFAS